MLRFKKKLVRGEQLRSMSHVTTYPTMGVWAKSQRSVFQKEKLVGVATHVYSRENVRKNPK